MRVSTAAFCALLLATACGKNAPEKAGQESVPVPQPTKAEAEPAQDPTPSPSATPGQDSPVGQTIGDSTFSVTPGSFRACDATDGSITATAKWDVSAMGVETVSIFAQAPGGERTLWLDAEATGESTTGKWVFGESKFTLMQGGTDRVLGELVVHAVACE